MIKLISLTNPGCPACRMMAPAIEDIAKRYPELQVTKLQANQNLALGQQYQLESVPAFLLFRDGEFVGKLVGRQKYETLESFVRQAYGDVVCKT